MRNLWTECKEINPLAVHTYFDVVGCWSKNQLTQQELAVLNSHCGGGVKAENGPAWFDWSYRQKLTLYRPSNEALSFLLACDDLLLNYVEITVELIMPDETATRQILYLFNSHFVQPWHRKQEFVFYPDGASTRASPNPAQRRSGRWFQWYGDRPSKITGEVPCFRFEAKYQGIQALCHSTRRGGIHTVADLLNFDHRAFWARQLNFFALDLERLGRFHLNRRSGSRRRKPRLQPRAYNRDRALGSVLYRHFARNRGKQWLFTLQDFVDRYGRGPFLQRLDVNDLPAFHTLLHEHINIPQTSLETPLSLRPSSNRPSMEVPHDSTA
jgi:hypothetical protein